MIMRFIKEQEKDSQMKDAMSLLLLLMLLMFML